ncbi:fumarylacetoacetate hydrolase family protein [Kribbella sp. NPDC050470]|uniref:fumarylacetoacetate hydrolase family protein n=1 Tax=unclassified Kribbella TaxID=2644121 RepID=UPI0037939C3A
MLVARIQVTAGPHQGARTYADVQLDADDTASYHPIADPFASDAAGTISTTSSIPAERATLLAPCHPRVIVGMAHNTGPADQALPPQAFHKSPHSVIAPGEAIELEVGRHHHIDAEAELAVVIGTPARNLTRDNALTAVFGYTCANDVTDRTAQASDSLWTTAKSRDTYTPLGPWIRTDLDPSDVAVQLGDETGLGPQASTAGLARGVADVLVYLSAVMTLHPGDVVLCGAAAKNHSSGTPRTRLRRPQSRLTTRQRELYALWQKELGPRSGIAGCRGSVALACAV